MRGRAILLWGGSARAVCEDGVVGVLADFLEGLGAEVWGGGGGGGDRDRGDG